MLKIVRGLPLLSALRLRFPHAELAWLAEESNTPLLNRLLTLDRLIIVKEHCLDSWHGIMQLRNRLQNFAPDVTIDLQNKFGSALAAWISGAKVRIGFGGKEGQKIGKWLNNNLIIPDAEHIIEQNMQLLQPFGIYGSSISFDLFECEMDRYSAQKILDRSGLHGNFVIVCVGADLESKLWREERYAGLTKYLFEQWNLPSLVVWSNDNEHKIAERIVNNSDSSAILAPQMTLNEFAATARLSTLVLGTDSTMLHTAAAIGTRCCGLFGTVNATKNAPYGEKNRIIQKLLSTHNTKKNIKTHMDAIDVQSVCNTCDEMLAEIIEPPKMKITPKKTAKKAA
jgi:ADP-heptose:LPS heptosyltransferase